MSRPPSTGCARRACPRPPRSPAASPPRASSRCVVEGLKGLAVEVNSETDFVARNPEFQDLVSGIAEVALKVGDDVEAIKTAAYRRRRHGRGQDRRHGRQDRREHDAAPRQDRCRSAQGALATYVHNPAAPGLGKIGVVVALESAGRMPRSSPSSAARSPCTSPRPTRSRSMRRASMPRRSSARRPFSPTSIASRASRKRRSPRSSSAGIKTYFKEVTLLEQAFVIRAIRQDRSRQALKESRRRRRRPDQGGRLRALCSRRGHREAGKRTSPPRSLPRPARSIGRSSAPNVRPAV